VRARGDDDRVRLGQSLQPGGEVWGFADDGLLLGRAFADQIADDNQPGSNADPRLRLDGFDVEAGHSIDHAQPGPDRALRIILMRLRVAEINQHAVAHVFGDKAVKPCDGPRDGAVISGNDLAVILGIEPRRQLSRPHEIAEHHRQLPTFSRWCSRSLRRRNIDIAVQCGDRIEQFSTVASEHYAQILEILLRELGQRLPIDLVVAEGGLVALETQTLQPRRYVHQAPPNSSSSAFACLRSGMPKPSVNQP